MTGFLLDAAMTLGLIVVFAFVGSVLGPKPKHAEQGELPYETGEVPLEAAASRMTVLYWRFAVLFVVFDVDLAFLLPWALSRDTITRASLVGVTVFTGLVLMMLAYFWRKGALEVSS